MTDVGISGGMIIQHMGTPAEVAAFFALIERHKSESANGALDLVTDRLFRRTVPGEQYDALVDQLAESRRILERVRISDGFWNEFKLGDRVEGIDRSAKTAADAFRKIFQSLDKAIHYARRDKEDIGYFRPVMLMAWEGPKSFEHESMPLEDFEKPDIRPIWME
ncbi:MAG: hypothetical protein Q8K93_11710 [Reyranella sp.]|uniref:hypothetical protein n=1 Tax=Reyranella sp. TaxID=1929291 RepID=UPI0027322AAE|nr:hypothetical protein [Reyranella sp.]MDP1962853.1 hypothetical protein [Reyranella sp.]MDP2378521.1 hypothetical protein [Reyranella sp.]